MRTTLTVVSLVFFLMTGVAYAEDDSRTTPICKTPYESAVSVDMIAKWAEVMRYVPERLVLKIRLSFTDAYGFPREDIVAIQGGGFIVGEYLVTVLHMKSPTAQMLPMLLLAKGYKSFGNVKAKETWFEILYADDVLVIGGVDALQFVASSEEFHLSLYKLAVSVPPKYKFALPFGDSLCLEIGTAVILGGNPGKFGRNFRVGHVSSLHGGKIENAGEDEFSLKAILEEATFMVQLPVIPGDSGHPLVSVTKTGEMVVTGIAFTTIPGVFYGDVRLILRVEAVKAFFREHGIDYENTEKEAGSKTNGNAN